MEVNETEALNWYNKSAEHGSAEGMASFAQLVAEHVLTEHYEQAYIWLKKCKNMRNNDLCRFSTAYLTLYDSVKSIKKGVKPPITRR